MLSLDPWVTQGADHLGYLSIVLLAVALPHGNLRFATSPVYSRCSRWSITELGLLARQLPKVLDLLGGQSTRTSLVNFGQKTIRSGFMSLGIRDRTGSICFSATRTRAIYFGALVGIKFFFRSPA